MDFGRSAPRQDRSRAVHARMAEPAFSRGDQAPRHPRPLPARKLARDQAAAIRPKATAWTRRAAHVRRAHKGRKAATGLPPLRRAAATVQSARSHTCAATPCAGSANATAQLVVPKSIPMICEGCTMLVKDANYSPIRTLSSSFHFPSPPFSRQRNSRVPSSVTAACKLTGTNLPSFPFWAGESFRSGRLPPVRRCPPRLRAALRPGHRGGPNWQKIETASARRPPGRTPAGERLPGCLLPCQRGRRTKL